MKMLASKKLIEHVKSLGMTSKFDGNDMVITYESKGTSARLSHKDGSIVASVYVTESNKNIDSYDINLENISNANEAQNQMIKAVNVFKTLSESGFISDCDTSDSLEPNISDNNDDDCEIINEKDPNSDDDVVTENDSTDIPSGLKIMHEMSQELGNKLRALSAATDDVEMVTVIMDLANTAYSLAIDIDDAYQTYIDLLQTDEE